MNDKKTYDVVFSADAEISTVKLAPFEDILGRWVKIPTSLRTNEIVAPNGTQDLLADLYWELYKTHPKTKNNIPDVRTVNRAVLDMVKESPEWNKLRIQTKASIYMSSLCASGILSQLLQDEKIKEALKKQEQAKELEDQLKEQAQQQQCAGGQQSKKDQQQGESQKKQLVDEALKSLGKDGLDPQSQDSQPQHGNMSKMQKTVGKAVRKAKADSQQAQQLAKSWGMEDGGDGEVDIEDIMSLMEYYQKNAKVKTVTAHMGRVKGISTATRKHHSKVKGTTISRDGYTQDLHRMFPAEMALLRKDVNPLIRAQKSAEYCDRGLLGMIKESQATRLGPLVIAVDESGSMSGDGILKAKGLALGICLSALENGQPFTAFGFSNHIETEVCSEDTRTKLMEWSVRFAEGGTNFDGAICHAVDIIKKSEYKHTSDFVLITDGQSGVTSETEKRFKAIAEEYGTRMVCFGIDVGSSVIEDNKAFQMADAYIDVDNLENLDELSQTLTDKLMERDIHGN